MEQDRLSRIVKRKKSNSRRIGGIVTEDSKDNVDHFAGNMA